jgi:chitinase
VKSGFKSSKILLGIPAYGYAYTLLSSELQPSKFSGLKQKTSLLFQNTTAKPPQGGKISATPGHWMYHELYLDGKLTKDGRRGTSGYKRHFDKCTRTVSFFSASGMRPNLSEHGLKSFE